MNIRKITIFLFILFVHFSISQEAIIYSIPINEMIDLGLSPFVKRAIKEAEKNNAKLIILDIDTFGGRVDAAVQIRDALLNTKIKTIAFVNKRAISAGALISLACKEIVMTKGATIGAATPIEIGGSGNAQPVAEKYVSYVRKEFKATAEANNYPSELAEAMVDKDVEIKGIIEKGKLLTLTTNEALKYGLIKYEVKDIQHLLEIYECKRASIIFIKPNWAEKLVRFLTNPIVSSLLLSLGFIGLLLEFKTPGWGITGTLALICLVLYFGGHYIVGLAGIEEILLFILGIILLTIEFFIPGFGIFGVLGIIALIISLFLVLISKHPTLPDLKEATTVISSSILISGIFIILFFKYFFFGIFYQKISLQTTQKDFKSSQIDNSIFGKTGVALTDLRPVGKALIENKRYDVISEGNYITKNTQIKVIKIENNRIVVKLNNEVEVNF